MENPAFRRAQASAGAAAGWLLAVLLTTSASAAALLPDTPDLAPAVSREEAVVVTVRVVTLRSGDLDDGMRRKPDPNRLPREEGGIASGFIVSHDGEILTNAHAVANAVDVQVRLADGRQMAARVLGLDTYTDVALLKVDAAGLPTAAIGDSGHLAPGQWVVAIGAPFGLDTSVTAGVVSAPRRYLAGSGVPLIQTDVAVNPGSSGGPLFDLRGNVVGINSMIFSRSGGYMGVSLAVPIDLAMQVAQALRVDGRVVRGTLGLEVQEASAELGRSFGLPDASGAIVLRAVRGGPAERAGLHSGDILLGTGSRTDATMVELEQEIADARPGRTLTLNVWRRGALQRVELTVAAAPADVPLDLPQPIASHADRLGLDLAELSPAARAALHLESGLAVLEASGAGLMAGVQPDDIVVAVADAPVNALADFDHALAALDPARPVPLLVMRDGVLGYLAVPAPRRAATAIPGAAR
ncbi:MAG: trypsin-like peptidase domain-containing protein [Proteobacteria bacterium]|nr:trypsin-like peptidase domain-containing protein [Pseudomonadota bacterium]